MSLDIFRSVFKVTALEEVETLSGVVDSGIEELGMIFREAGGMTFNQGLYRVIRSEQVPRVTRAVESLFPEYSGRVIPFGFDWLGRYFACDLARIENGKPLVLMLETGAGVAMEIPVPVLEFHNVELVNYADDALAVKFWRQWLGLYPGDLAFSQCVGYKVPLFLGGADVVENLEVIDLDIYVEVCGQLRNKIKRLHPGQSIRGFSFE